jgi:hypothetical protein
MLVASGACIRGPLLLIIGLPLTVAGLSYDASRAMWSRGRTDDDSRRGGFVLPLAWLLTVGLLAPRGVGPDWYIAMRRTYFVLVDGSPVPPNKSTSQPSSFLSTLARSG